MKIFFSINKKNIVINIKLFFLGDFVESFVNVKRLKLYFPEFNIVYILSNAIFIMFRAKN